MRRPLFHSGSASWTKQLIAAATFLYCVNILHQFPIPTLHNLRITSDVDVEMKQGPAQNAICKLANNLDVESQNCTSYKLGLDWSNVDHVTKSLCRRSSRSCNDDACNNCNRVDRMISNETSLILTFKAARSGSTFFTDVLMRSLQAMKRAANLNWEPYCRVGCYQVKSHILMDSELSAILSYNWIIITGYNTLNPHKKCCPVPKCSTKFNRNATSVLSLNPRFSDSVRWDKILSPSFPRTFSARVLNLRRTNLIKLAYSKYHHGGCPAIIDGNLTNDCTPEKKKNSTSFSFDCLLHCVQHYGE